MNIDKNLLKVKIQALAIDCIRALKKYYTYRDLAKILGISEALLCRYLKGDVAPSPSRALDIIRKIKEEKLLEKIINRILVLDESGIVNIYFIAFNHDILKLASAIALLEFRDYDVNKILTAATNGIPLAICLSDVLNAEVVVAKRDRDAGILEYLEASYLTLSPPVLSSLYVPRSLLKRGDRVLIVDDLLRTGRTLKALITIANKAKASIIGVFALISLGNAWREFINEKIRKVIIIKNIKV